jgi:hypothetical protein
MAPILIRVGQFTRPFFTNQLLYQLSYASVGLKDKEFFGFTQQVGSREKCKVQSAKRNGAKIVLSSLLFALFSASLFPQLHRLHVPLPYPQIQHFHKHRERHRKVNVSLRDVLMERLSNK